MAIVGTDTAWDSACLDVGSTGLTDRRERTRRREDLCFRSIPCRPGRTVESRASVANVEFASLKLHGLSYAGRFMCACVCVCVCVCVLIE
jgi:hypothetical protein